LAVEHGHNRAVSDDDLSAGLSSTSETSHTNCILLKSEVHSNSTRGVEGSDLDVCGAVALLGKHQPVLLRRHLRLWDGNDDYPWDIYSHIVLCGQLPYMNQMAWNHDLTYSYSTANKLSCYLVFLSAR